MAKDYNIMAGAGISDQDFVDMQGLPQELAQTANLHLWMTYQIKVSELFIQNATYHHIFMKLLKYQQAH